MHQITERLDQVALDRAVRCGQAVLEHAQRGLFLAGREERQREGHPVLRIAEPVLGARAPELEPALDVGLLLLAERAQRGDAAIEGELRVVPHGRIEALDPAQPFLEVLGVVVDAEARQRE